MISVAFSTVFWPRPVCQDLQAYVAGFLAGSEYRSSSWFYFRGQLRSFDFRHGSYRNMPLARLVPCYYLPRLGCTTPSHVKGSLWGVSPKRPACMLIWSLLCATSEEIVSDRRRKFETTPKSFEVLLCRCVGTVPGSSPNSVSDRGFSIMFRARTWLRLSRARPA